MKATGIVRRIDDLGRIVIPKEIRRMLRVREGDPMEIFVNNNGEVILKKYSPVAELGDFAKDYVESLHESTGHIAVITDRDTVVAVAGGYRKDFYEKPVGPLVESIMDSRSSKVESNSGQYVICQGSGETYRSYAISSIVQGGNAIGAVILLSSNTVMGRMELKMAETTASFLAKHMDC